MDHRATQHEVVTIGCVPKARSALPILIGKQPFVGYSMSLVQDRNESEPPRQRFVAQLSGRLPQRRVRAAVACGEDPKC